MNGDYDVKEVLGVRDDNDVAIIAICLGIPKIRAGFGSVGC